MKSLPETLPDETNALQKMVLDYQSTVDQLQEKRKRRFFPPRQATPLTLKA
ncbi:hypothetical protein [Bathymodiolus platifrons methanotrophic gill symbiont]|uniref:hypothetical protein n=1 Tax=Bathymodiolus platifrons methanotrophic gill symbiont TaxID=113268 RepID=UPI001C8CFE64|nr:hypothetical protein [Bathymodiolus platifrons methanotrophic gill symbiont]